MRFLPAICRYRRFCVRSGFARTMWTTITAIRLRTTTRPGCPPTGWSIRSEMLTGYSAPPGEISAVYGNLFAAEAEDGLCELSFRDLEAAQTFSRWSLRQSQWFVSDDDRFFMQALADLLRFAIRTGAITKDDLLLTEPSVLAKLTADPVCARYWAQYRRITGTCAGKTPPEHTYAVRVRAKKRHINPLVQTHSGMKRQTELDEGFAAQLRAFLQDDFDRFVWASFAD